MSSFTLSLHLIFICPSIHKIANQETTRSLTVMWTVRFAFYQFVASSFSRFVIFLYTERVSPKATMANHWRATEVCEL